MKFSSLFLSLILVLSLTACGGGGSTNAPATNNPPALPPPQVVEEPEVPQEPEVPGETEVPEEAEVPEDWLALIEEDPTTKSEGRLQDIYAGAAYARYQGSTELAEITPESVQQYFKILYQSPYYSTSSLGYTISHFHFREWGGIIEFDHSGECYQDGSVDVIGRANDNEAIAAIQYSDCSDASFSTWGSINGSGALYIENRSATVRLAEPYNYTQFYNSISTSSYNQRLEITGFYQFAFADPESEDTGFSSQEVFLFIYPDTGEQYVRHLDNRYVNLTDEEYTAVTGSLMIDYLGKVNLTHNAEVTGLIEPDRSTILSGRHDAQACLNFLSGAVELLLDQDGDGVFEVGQYFPNISYILANDFSKNPLVPVAQMNRPPVVYQPTFNATFLEDDPIELRVRYQDFDTPEEDLRVTVYWSLNYEPLVDFHELILPADRTSAGDTISFYFEVFDGTHTVRSETVNILIYGDV